MLAISGGLPTASAGQSYISIYTVPLTGPLNLDCGLQGESSGKSRMAREEDIRDIKEDVQPMAHEAGTQRQACLKASAECRTVGLAGRLARLGIRFQVIRKG